MRHGRMGPRSSEVGGPLPSKLRASGRRILQVNQEIKSVLAAEREEILSAFDGFLEATEELL